MPGSSFGQRLRVTTFGESHGAAVGVVVDGFPAGHPFPLAAIQTQLDRRRPGRSRLASSRKEPDRVQVLSGVDPESGRTLGTPIAMVVHNADARGSDYRELARVYRPSHADFTHDARFGLRFVGYLRVEEDGLYTFRLTSDDGSTLRVSGHTVIDHDGPHGVSGREGQIALAAGYHPIEVRYFQRGGDATLRLEWRRGAGPFRVVPPRALVRRM